MRGSDHRPRIGGRSARVVRDVLRATVEELALHGFSALSVESVAQRAQVNKTTIYRRWPTKGDLVRAAFMASAQEQYAAPAGGPIRDVIVAGLMVTVDKLSTPAGRSIMRMMVSDDIDADLLRIVEAVREARTAQLRALLDRAISRGELPRGVDQELLFSMLVGAVFYRLFVLRKSMPRVVVESLVDLALLGVVTAAKKRGPRERKPRPTTRKTRPESRSRRRL
jgi:AcrR family transcriptional regulator